MNLSLLKKDIALPKYDRSFLQEKIVHLGLGAFHRAHQALIVDEINNQAQTAWGICAIGSEIADKLQYQDCLFSILECDENGVQGKIIGSIINTLRWDLGNRQAMVNKIAESQVELVTLTITEKGYCTTFDTRELDSQHEIIQHDLRHLDAPQSIPAILYWALKKRAEYGCCDLTLLSCDNIPENGKVLRRAVTGFAQLVEPEFISYIDQHVTFPSSMVDRIVPATTEEILKLSKEVLGQEDPCTVSTEPFLQWVIEDDFAKKTLDWASVVGVKIVKNIVPFEEMKLRMLNGSHSFLAYLGNLSGYAYIYDCIQDPSFKDAIYTLMMVEQAPTLSVHNINLAHYANDLIKRFGNRSLRHTTAQIAMDGSQKIPQRWLSSLVIHEARGGAHPMLTLGLAGWMQYVKIHSETLNDPLQLQIHRAITHCGDGKSFVNALLALETIFPEQLAQNLRFVNDLTQAYDLISEHGARQAVAMTVACTKRTNAAKLL